LEAPPDAEQMCAFEWRSNDEPIAGVDFSPTLDSWMSSAFE
jgi:hypothetical protein